MDNGASTMTEAEALKGLPKGSKGIDLLEKDTAYATTKAPFHKEGAVMQAHPNLIKKFIKQGFATKTEPVKK